MVVDKRDAGSGRRLERTVLLTRSGGILVTNPTRSSGSCNQRLEAEPRTKQPPFSGDADNVNAA